MTTLVATSGCGVIEKASLDMRDAVKVEDGGIMREGILKGGINPKLEVQPGAFPEPLVKVDRGAFEIQPGAFQGPALKVEPEAFKIVVESGAVTLHEGAVNINLLGPKKIPKVNIEQVRAALQGLKPLDGLDAAGDEIKNRVINNEKIYQVAIKALLDVIDQVNKKYGVEKQQPED